MNTVRFLGGIWTKPAPRVPGDTRRVLTQPATDTEGKRYQRGTYLMPQAGGYDNTRQDHYADVVILGR